MQIIILGLRVFWLYWAYWVFVQFIAIIPKLSVLLLNLFLILNSISFDSFSINSFSIDTQVNSSNFVSFGSTGDYYFDNNNLVSNSVALFDLEPLLFIFNTNNFNLIDSTNLGYNSESGVLTMSSPNRYAIYSFYFCVSVFLLCFDYPCTFCNFFFLLFYCVFECCVHV